MSNTQDIYTELGDEALDAPEQHALACTGTCGFCYPCMVSDEPLDAPTQEALACVPCAICTISDEELDAQERKAFATFSGCAISDEVLAAR